MYKVQTPKELLEAIGQDGEGQFDPNLGIPFETPPITAQPGHKWVYNRWSQVFTITFDGHEAKWGGYCYRMCPVEMATFAERKGYLKYDPMGVHMIYALVSQDHKLYGDPLPPDTQRPVEVLHRDGINAPTQIKIVEIPK